MGPVVVPLSQVDSLRFATLATVSRCGMVWFSHDTVTDTMLLTHHLQRLRSVPAHSTSTCITAAV